MENNTIFRYFLLFLIVLSVNSCTIICFGLRDALSNSTDLSALLAFKNSIKHDPNKILNNWNTTTSFCYWVGVSCSKRRQRVISLELPNMGLIGTISPFIGNISFLKVLRLENNSLYGNLIPDLGQLPRLQRVFLYLNHLEGEIPSTLQHCTKLQLLSLVDNSLTGTIPIELTTLPSLNFLNIGGNNLTGEIPASVGNMSSLEIFSIMGNNIYGSLPYEMVHLPNLKLINFKGNHLSGSIPPELFNMSSFEQISLSDNALSGTLPSNLGLWLPNLEHLYLDGNRLHGEIPRYLSNSSKLHTLALQRNRFTGSVRTNLGQLKLLERFSIARNQLTLESGDSQLSFLTSMTNCSSLQYLFIQSNPWNGILPDSIGNFSSTLKWFGASSCQLIGEIPRGIGSLNVNLLELENNNLHGTIPQSIVGMKNLQRLYLHTNALQGSIPEEICKLSNLGEIYLLNNNLSGSIPYCIGNISHLKNLFLSSNVLNSSIPLSLWSLKDLLSLDLSSNFLHGSLNPNIGLFKNLVVLNLSRNQISGEIPSAIGAFQSLSFIDLSKNSFEGPIPESLANLKTLDVLDLSHNNLTGTIPKPLESLPHLNRMNLSFNMLSGEIPSGGLFRNLTSESFMGNAALCGQLRLQVPPCPSNQTHRFGSDRFLKFILPPLSFLVIVVSCLIISKKYQVNKSKSSKILDPLVTAEYKMFSYRDLIQATDNFCESNLLGVGSYGSVYKAILLDGEIVAVKILNLQVEGALKSFDVECKVLSTIRHRNLVKIISTCSNTELKALILQYMPNGSLEKFLYSHNYCLNLLERLGIMIDVASALEYLHYGLIEPIVHCDLKPSNVLLDLEMVAHVADFGIAKILALNKSDTQTETLGTLGYIAPEYGLDGRVSTKGDIYSFGIMLLETFTRKKPTNEMFIEGMSFREWVNVSIPDKVMNIVDASVFNNVDHGNQTALATNDCVLAVMELGLKCCEELPEMRIDAKDVLLRLDKIKRQLLHIPRGP